MSIDGYIDDTSGHRLILSNAADFNAVDQLRSDSDAILVGAGTIRADNPKLLVRSKDRQSARVRAGMPPHPMKATLTSTGEFDPAALFFQIGDCPKIVYCPATVVSSAERVLQGLATVVSAGDSDIDPARILDDLSSRGIKRLLIEGGSTVNSLFLTHGLVDELRVCIAPFFVGEDAAPRFVRAGQFLHDVTNRMFLSSVTSSGDCAVLKYQLERK
jgi:5-amino-6-(5-phosphoribosylamino)uracil reductase